MIKFKDIKTDQDQKINKVIPPFLNDAHKDGNLISEIIISNHGLNTDRFTKLNKERRLYSEELLCQIIQNLCIHLDELVNIRKYPNVVC